MKKCVYNIDFQETNHIMSDNQHLVRKKYHVYFTYLLSNYEISYIEKLKHTFYKLFSYRHLIENFKIATYSFLSRVKGTVSITNDVIFIRFG